MDSELIKQTGNIPIYAQNMLRGLEEMRQQWESQVRPNFNTMEGEWAGLAFDAAGQTFTQLNQVMMNQLVELENFCQNVVKFHGETTTLDQMGQRMLSSQ